MDADLTRAEIAAGMRSHITKQEPVTHLSTRLVVRALSILNFLQWLALAGFSRLEGGRGIVNTSGIMGKWTSILRTAEFIVPIAENFRNDAYWRREALELRPAKGRRLGPEG